MALMDFFTDGSLGNMFGGAGAYGDLLSDEQKKRMQQQSMMAMAAKLLQAGAPSRTRTSLGSAIGEAFGAGQQAYSQAGQDAMQQALVGQKAREAKATQEREAAWRDSLSAGGLPQGLSPQQQAILAVMPMAEGQKWLMERESAASKWGAPFSAMIDGKPVMMRQNELGKQEVIAGAAPYEATPSKLREMAALGFSLNPQGYEQFAAASRPSTNVSVNTGGGLILTPGQKKVDENFAQNYVDWQQGGGADAVANMAQIGSVLKQLESGKPLTGPMVGLMPDLVLAITNPKAAGAKEQVQEVVQRNLRAVLGAQFTQQEGDRLIARAYNPALSPQQNAARLRKLFEQMSLAARQKQAMSDYFEASGTLQGYKGQQPNINQFYKALEEQPQSEAAGANPAAKYFK